MYTRQESDEARIRRELEEELKYLKLNEERDQAEYEERLRTRRALIQERAQERLLQKERGTFTETEYQKRLRTYRENERAKRFPHREEISEEEIARRRENALRRGRIYKTPKEVEESMLVMNEMMRAGEFGDPYTRRRKRKEQLEQYLSQQKPNDIFEQALRNRTVLTRPMSPTRAMSPRSPTRAMSPRSPTRAMSPRIPTSPVPFSPTYFNSRPY